MLSLINYPILTMQYVYRYGVVSLNDNNPIKSTKNTIQLNSGEFAIYIALVQLALFEKS